MDIVEKKFSEDELKRKEQHRIATQWIEFREKQERATRKNTPLPYWKILFWSFFVFCIFLRAAGADAPILSEYEYAWIDRLPPKMMTRMEQEYLNLENTNMLHKGWWKDGLDKVHEEQNVLFKKCKPYFDPSTGAMIADKDLLLFEVLNTEDSSCYLLDGKPVAKGRWCGIYLVSFAGKSYYVPIFNEILSCNHSFASGIPGKIVMSSYAMQQLFFYDNLCSVEALESYVGMPEFEKLVYNNFFEAVGTPAFFVDDARATNNQKTAKIFDYSKVILRNENGRIQINRKMYDAVVKAGEDAKRRQGRKDGVLW